MRNVAIFVLALLPVFARGDVRVAAGDATQDSIVLLARPTVDGPVTFRWSQRPEMDTYDERVVDGTRRVPPKTLVQGLTPGATYTYVAIDAAGASGRGRFRMPATRGRLPGLRFGVTGDWRGDLRPYPAVSNIPRCDLDFLVVMGDTMYADYASPAVPRRCESLDDFRLKHAEVYEPVLGRASMADAQATTVWYATIDDHEIVNDFAGGASPVGDRVFGSYPGEFVNDTELYRDAIQAMHEHHPIREERYRDDAEPRFAGKPRFYRTRRFGDTLAFFLLDARSFRDAPIEGGILGGGRDFLRDAFAPGRTMLGREQVEDLKRDLLEAERDGIVWKAVLIPEPIQNLGPILADDRYEGFAAERNELLAFIHGRGLRNVVFITADIHCTITNNLLYQEAFGGPQIPVASWEISTGAVAFAPPFGPLAVEMVSHVPWIGPIFSRFYDSLSREGKDKLLLKILNQLLRRGKYDPVGMATVPGVRLLEGGWTSMNTFGWTEFEIHEDDLRLTVTTYGVDWYDGDDLREAPEEIASREPFVVGRFEVEARPVPRPCAADLNTDGAVDLLDLGILLFEFSAGTAGGDVNGDGVTDISDLVRCLMALGAKC